MQRVLTFIVDAIDNEKSLVKRVKKIDGVADCSFDGKTLACVLADGADKNHVLIEVNETCAALGGTLDVGETTDYDVRSDGDDQDNDIEDGNSVEVVAENDDSDESEPAGEQKPKKGFFDDEEDYSDKDRAVFKRNKDKKEAYFKVGELVVAIILFVISVLIEGSATQFGFKSVLTVLAFAIGGYEIFYSAIGDIARKKFLSENLVITFCAVMGALLGYVTQTALLVIIYSIVKAIETYAVTVSLDKLDETFYTGSVDVKLSDGRVKSISDLAVGDEYVLNEYDVVPCDCVTKTDAVVDAYNVCGKVELFVKAGELLPAGCVVLSKSLTAVVEKPNAESKITLEKRAFEERLNQIKKPQKTISIFGAAWIAVGLLLIFIPPFFTKDGYLIGLREWGARGVAVLSATMIFYTSSLVAKTIVGAMINARSKKIDFKAKQDLLSLGLANCLTFNASLLIENGEMKEDVYGCMNELLNSGVKNVRTLFDVQPSDQVKAKLSFKQKALKNERNLSVGEFVTLSGGGNVDIINGELSFVPLAYKIARRAVKGRRLIVALNSIEAVAVLCGALVVPFAAFNPIFMAAIGAGLSVISAIVVLLSA